MLLKYLNYRYTKNWVKQLFEKREEAGIKYLLMK